MKNLLVRIITAVILLPLVVAVFLAGGIFLKFLLLLASLICVFEISTMVLPNSKIGLFTAFMAWFSLSLPSLCEASIHQNTAAAFLGFLCINGLFLFVAEIEKSIFEKMSTIFYFSSYVVLGLNCLFWLQNDSVSLNKSEGLAFILLTCIATWGNDTCAYFGGRIFGKRPLFKSVSAKKTWEGFFFGAIGSLLLIFLIKKLTSLYNTPIFAQLDNADLLWVGIPAIIFAPLGDLIESKFKRIYQAKDSSNILPGHGGLLDRIDALILVLPWTALYAFIIRPLC
ncbi:MAG: phosphatidate cytidylyltransferase [Myxococcales bacterium]|nr:phosphatidate cytidylyltransferase [Myxococcales bacterium]USN50342.1 MAG: phosphatidate cytidylyltransferase [Myxococcales bacterium]